MSRTAQGQVTVNVTSTITNNLTNTSKTSNSQVGSSTFVTQALTSGVQANEINRAWEDTTIDITSGNDLEINLGSFAGLDIGGGVGKDALGQTMDLEEIVFIGIKNTSTALTDGSDGPFLEVKPSTASGWTAIGEHTVANGGRLGPGGALMKFAPGEAGFDIQVGTSDRITLEAVGGDVSVQVVILGRNDDDDSSSSASSSSSSVSSSSISSSSVSSSSLSSLSSSSTS